MVHRLPACARGGEGEPSHKHVSPDSCPRTNGSSKLSRLPPALVLFLLSPILGELVSAFLSPLEFFHPLRLAITVVPYGCGAIVARELVVRRGKGFASVLLLGLAFGLFFEGIVTRVLFNPEWGGLGPLARYGRAFDFHWVLAVGIVHFQAMISIVCPILLTELLYPGKRNSPWIGTPGLILCCGGAARLDVRDGFARRVLPAATASADVDRVRDCTYRPGRVHSLGTLGGSASTNRPSRGVRTGGWHWDDADYGRHVHGSQLERQAARRGTVLRATGDPDRGVRHARPTYQRRR